MTDHSQATKRPQARQTKLDILTAKLSRKGGATIGELAKATGWQDHSVRGALAGTLRKKGVEVTSSKIDGVRRYEIKAKADA